MTVVQGRWILGGGIASGKSLVRRILEQHGVSTIDADAIGHEVLEPGGLAYVEVAALWPEVVEEDEINRRRLGEIVFSDASELETLEAITHPHIFDMITTRVEEIGADTVVVEMPLVGSRLGDGWRQIVVDCRDELRVQRAVGRGMDENDVRARMSAQLSRAEWLAKADLVVPNHGSIAELEQTVESLIPSL